MSTSGLCFRRTDAKVYFGYGSLEDPSADILLVDGHALSLTYCNRGMFLPRALSFSNIFTMLSLSDFFDNFSRRFILLILVFTRCPLLIDALKFISVANPRGLKRKGCRVYSAISELSLLLWWLKIMLAKAIVLEFIGIAPWLPRGLTMYGLLFIKTYFSASLILTGEVCLSLTTFVLLFAWCSSLAEVSNVPKPGWVNVFIRFVYLEVSVLWWTAEILILISVRFSGFYFDFRLGLSEIFSAFITLLFISKYN